MLSFRRALAAAMRAGCATFAAAPATASGGLFSRVCTTGTAGRPDRDAEVGWNNEMSATSCLAPRWFGDVEFRNRNECRRLRRLRRPRRPE